MTSAERRACGSEPLPLLQVRAACNIEGEVVLTLETPVMRRTAYLTVQEAETLVEAGRRALERRSAS